MSTSFGRRLAWAGLAILATFVLFFGGAWLGLYLTDLRIVTITAAGALLAAWGIAAWRNPAWRAGSVLLPAMLACLASLAVSTIFSRYPRISLEYLGYAVVLAGLYLLLVRLLADSFYRARIVSLAAALFAVVVVGYVFFVVRDWVDWWSATRVLAVPPLRPNYESLTYGTPSTVLTVAAMLAVPTIATVLRAPRLGVAAAFAVVLLVGVISVLTGSRAGWVALGIAGVVTIVVAIADRATRATLLALATPRVRKLVGVVAVLGLLLAVVLGPAILRRVAGGGEENRLVFTRIALELFTESPVVGTGPGSWVIERLPHTQPDDPDEYIPHAHDVYAQTLGELGLVGGAAGLFLAGSLALLCWRAMRSRDSTRRVWGWLTFTALVYFAAHQIFDFYPNMPAVLFTAAIPVAYLDALTVGDSPGRTGPLWFWTLPRPLELVAAALAAVSVTGLLLQEMPSRAHDEAVDLANNGNWAAALAPALMAAREDPAVSPYRFTAGLAEAWSGDAAAAAAEFEVVAERDDFPEAWLNLAAEQGKLGETDEALASLRSALRLGRQRSVISMPAGDLALRVGDADLAIEAFSDALSVSPSLAGDPWWTSDPARAAAWPAILQRADTAIAPMARWELALMHGDRDSARVLASTTADPQYTLEVIDAWSGVTAALDALLAGCDANPTALDPLLWCSRLADHAGNADAASRYRYLANVQAPGIYRAAHELRVELNPPTVYPILEGGASIAWGTYTYRRVTAWDVLAPGLIRLGFA
jgi:O-antigen ligase/tetratricopeptide (TPR) repeat protein